MWRKIKEILCKHTAYKDESTPTTLPSTITASVIDLKPLPPTPSRRTETLHHHQQQQQHHHQRRPYRKATNKSTLNKTDEHCRSLFNLLPASFRSRHQHHQTSASKGIDASTTTQASPSNDLFGTDYDSGYMSQSVLNRTSSYVSCYSGVATTTPISSMVRHGSIENLLHGHSKSNPAHVRVLVRKNFEPFAQAHVAVAKGAIVTALFSRGPWLYIRMESNGQTGYIPRIICSVYKPRTMVNEKNYHHHLSISSTDSSSNRDDELDLTIMSGKGEKHFIRPYQHEQQQQQQINRYLSQSSAMINEQQKYQEHPRKHFVRPKVDERERRSTCTLPPPPPIHSTKDRRLTLNAVNWPLTTKQADVVGIHQTNDVAITTTTATTTIPPTRDTDSSSTQDSGYSESTPYFLVQHTSPDAEQPPLLMNNCKTSASSPQYATVRRASQLKAPDLANSQHHSLRRQQPSTKGADRPQHHRHTLLNGISMTEGLNDDINKRHSFGNFYTTEQKLYDSIVSKMNPSPKASTAAPHRPIEFALIRNVRRDPDELYQRNKPAIHNLPKSHRQIPASIFLHHHRQQQKQQFGSSHSAFRPVQPTSKGKRASSEGHSPSNEENLIPSLVVSPSTSSLSSSSSSSPSSLSKPKSAHLTKQRRLSCDLPIPKSSKSNTSSLTRSVCDQISTNEFSRTMSAILCDQFSEINLDAIEKDSLQPSAVKKNNEETLRNLLHSSHESFTVLKDYRSSRASFSVKRGDRVDVLKQAGRACYLVRKQTNGQIGFLPRGLMTATPKTRVDTFLETHGYRETVI